MARRAGNSATSTATATPGMRRSPCSLKHEESCKVVDLYEQGLARDWLLPGPDDTEAIYHP